METYFPMTNNQRDAATMFYLRDRLANSNSETQLLPTNMVMYMNYTSSSAPYSDALVENPPTHRPSTDARPVASDPSTSQQEILLNFGGSSRPVESHISPWKDGRNEMLMMQETSGQGQGLSLSLSSHVPLQVSSLQYENDNADFSSIMGTNEDHSSHNKQYTNDIPSYGMQSFDPNSKFLRAAQELLDEVVNVKKGIKEQNDGKKEFVKNSKEIEEELCDGDLNTCAAKASRSEISVAEKQDLQNTMTKLLSMLDEVDRRYRQYYHQMQIVVSSFDVIAGSGSAKPYTAVALHTISRHFRCLRDVINNQIHVARKSLGEETDDCSNDKGVRISRLRYVDHQLRQHRALQQLGMMQQHVWRPQRGLPETSVSILRAWLFEHFLHPYPKDSDKIMLARQTGLTRSQVSNWFINARVRLWKPMVEEMYNEETGDADIDSNSSSETIPVTIKEQDFQQGTTTSTELIMDSKSDQMTDAEMMGTGIDSIFQTDYHEIGKTPVGQKETTRFPNGVVDYNRIGKARVEQKETTRFPNGVVNYRMGKATMGQKETTRFPEATIESNCGYDIPQVETFGHVGGVSLTLGLQQCENGGITMVDNMQQHHHGFVPMRETNAYNNIDFGYGD